METENIIKNCIDWIRSEYKDTDKSKAIVHITSTPSSIVTAKLCAKALGTAHVIGVSLPDEDNGETNLDASIICKMLDIKLVTIPIHWFIREACVGDITFTEKSLSNLRDRFRNNMLYCLADEYAGLVVSDLNYSNVHACDFTKFGTSVGDLLPLRYLCLEEIKKIGEAFKIPLYWMKLEDKPIAVEGLTYDKVDEYLLKIKQDPDVQNKVAKIYSKNVKKWDLDNSFEA